MNDLKDILFGKGPLLQLAESEKIPNVINSKKEDAHELYEMLKEIADWNPREFVQNVWDTTKQNMNEWLDNTKESWFGFVGWLYEKTTMLFFHTPIELLDNPKILELTNIFLEMAVWGVGIVVMVEGIRIMFKGKARNLGEILVKAVIGTVGAIIAPQVMIWGVWFVNKISTMILLKASSVSGNVADYSDTFMASVGDGGWELVGSIAFVAVYMYCLTKLLLVVAKRLFDLVVATSISPLAFSAYIFETTQKYFHMWGSHVMGLYLFQIVYTVYFTIFSAFIIIPLPAEWNSVWVRMLMIIGALLGISNPPKWITNLAGGKEFNPVQTYKRYKQWKNPTKGGDKA